MKIMWCSNLTEKIGLKKQEHEPKKNGPYI